jgi:7-cyano-7-deazaguanine synthase in queuosine biosynthesis
VREFSVVVDDCATASRPGARSVRFRQTQHGAKNFNFNVGRLAAGLPVLLDDRHLDWAHLMGSLFAADLACQRSIDTEWTRDIELHVALREPAYWEQHRIRLELLFSRLTYDRLTLRLHEDHSPPPPPRQRTTPFAAVDCIALFSGGMDSFVGAVELAASGRVPFFASHVAGGPTRAAQQRLQPVVAALATASEFQSISAQRAAGFGDVEGSQRSRTLLFVGCAAVVASSLGLSEIFLNENGVMAVHLPLTEARVGSLSTRTAAPSVLDEMSALISDALAAQMTVSNILIQDTKPDVVRRAQRLNCEAALPDTLSCWSVGHTGRHCGYCAPCMMRRISCAVNSAPDAQYEHDVFADPAVTVNRPFAQDNLAHFIGCVHYLTTASDLDVELDYPELLSGGSQVTQREALDVHRRWATEALPYLQAQPVSGRLL